MERSVLCQDIRTDEGRKKMNKNMQKKVVYLGFDLMYPALETLLKEGADVIRIYTCPCDNVTEFNVKIIELAEENHIPYTMEKITGQDLEELEAAGCELLVCAGYNYRVPVTDVFPMVNIHPAPLPYCRGAWPMPLILLGEYPEGGLAIHKMAKAYDAGDIILQETFFIEKRESLMSYMKKVHMRIPEMLRYFLEHMNECLECAVPQTEGRYLANPGESFWTVTFDMEAEKADRILRAFYGYECIYLTPEEKYELIGARVSYGNGILTEFPVKGGYITTEKVRKLK